MTLSYHNDPAVKAAHIDVLAVMDRTIARNIDRGAAKGSPSDRDLRAARNAVAELIEALKLIESAKERGFGIDYARGVALAAITKAGGAE